MGRRRKPRAYLWLEDGCLCWDITIPRNGGNMFAVELTVHPDGSRTYDNFQWSMPASEAESLPRFLAAVADLNLEANRKREAQGRVHRRARPARRMDVGRIRVKPDMEARFQHMLRRLEEDHHKQPS